MTTALIVNYNTPEYLERVLVTFRKFYPKTPVLVIDGSDRNYYEPIKEYDKRFNVELIHFKYNIHHGPGMAYGISIINTDQILLMDSDIIVHSGGWLEMMEAELKPHHYGTGDIQQEYILEMKKKEIASPIPEGKYKAKRPSYVRDSHYEPQKTWIPYMHPVLALINRKVAIKYPAPVKGGAPLLPAMEKIWRDGDSEKLLLRCPWLTEDLWQHTERYVQHNSNHQGMGTVKSTGGYHLELNKK